MEWGLALIGVILWMIYTVLKDCLAELKKLSNQVAHWREDSTLAEKIEWVRGDVNRLNDKLANVEEVADAYYKENIKARRGY